MVGDAVDLAAKTLCPMDHTPPPNLLDDSSLYVRIPEPQLTDDELCAVRSLMSACDGISFATLRQIISEHPSRAELCDCGNEAHPSWCDDDCATNKPSRADEPPTDDEPAIRNWLGRVEKAEGSTWRLSGGDIPRIHPLDGSAIYGWRNDRWSYSHDGGKSWRPTHGSADADLLYPASGEHWVEVVAEPSRAEGTQHADAPGEVSRGPLAAEPSPGEPSDEPVFKCTDLSCECQTDDRYLRSAPPPERPVSQEDLSAHIYAIANTCIIRRNDRVPRMADVCGEIATDLLSDYRITKK